MAVTETDRLLGKHGTMFIGTESGNTSLYASGDLFNWEAELSTQTEDFEAIEDDWMQRKPRIGDWSARAEKWVATVDFINALKSIIAARNPVWVEFYRGGDASVGAVVLEGYAIPTRASITNPNGGMQERIEFIGATDPTTVATS